jgi:lysine/ornithine N-monooxygenase
MAFWTASMPAGMYLRSDREWHLDPCGVLTLDRFCETRGLGRADVEPLSIDLYLAYARWFQDEARLEAEAATVERLERDGAAGEFRVALADGRALRARRIVLALGLQYFAHVPEDLARRLPAGRYRHSRDVVDFRPLRGRRVLVIGGRQGAFEWAALMNEAGAAMVDVAHRHESPRFAVSDWSWVAPAVARFDREPGWYRQLSAEERERVNQRLWAEGRLKIEPWLEARCRTERIRVRPRTQVASTSIQADRTIAATLETGETVGIDEIVLATGYRPEIAKVPFLARGDLLAGLETREGCPVLDDGLQTSVRGLFATSVLATKDFGPFFGFTVAVHASARLIGRALAAS